jgi:hypothetical protein
MRRLVLLLCFSFVIASCGGDSGTPSSPPIAQATTGSLKINFSDIASGPKSGLGDGLGEGAIVTIWGSGFGSQDASSKVYYTDSNGTRREVAHIYYWKNADGTLPGGPADLYSSHGMQEIAFSIPSASSLGAGSITIEQGDEISNGVPFTTSSSGSIYWVAPLGLNSNACTFDSPCKYINAHLSSGSLSGIANERLVAGDIVYSRGVTEPDSCGGGRCVGMFVRSALGTKDNPISIIAYPDNSSGSKIVSQDGGIAYINSKFINLSKYSISVGNTDPSLPANPGNPVSSDTHIITVNGRYVGNYLAQNPGTCITGWSGSISSGGGGGEFAKILGNEMDSLGCPNTSRFQHTTYMSIRNESISLTEAWEFSYNYLHDNYPMFGLHFYDEQINSGDCGTLSGTMRVTNNLIVNQWGAGINIASRDTAGTKNACWEADIHIENNILINTGLGDTLDDNVVPPAAAIRIGGDMNPSAINIINNTIYQWGSDKTLAANGDAQAMSINFSLPEAAPDVTIINNAIIARYDEPYIVFDPDFSVGLASNNLFHTNASTQTQAVAPPTWNGNVVSDPLISVTQSNITINPSSPLINGGVQTSITPTHDIFGNPRDATIDIGAIEIN